MERRCSFWEPTEAYRSGTPQPVGKKVGSAEAFEPFLTAGRLYSEKTGAGRLSFGTARTRGLSRPLMDRVAQLSNRHFRRTTDSSPASTPTAQSIFGKSRQGGVVARC